MASLRKNPFAAFILSLFHLLPISVHRIRHTIRYYQHDPVQQSISLHKTDFHGSKTRITSSHHEDETVDRYRNNSEGMMKTHQEPATSRSKSSRLTSRLQRNVSDISVRRFTRLRGFGQPLTCVCFKAGTTRVLDCRDCLLNMTCTMIRCFNSWIRPAGAEHMAAIRHGNTHYEWRKRDKEECKSELTGLTR